MQLPGSVRQRVAVGLLTVSLSGFGAWKASEGFTDTAVIPTKGDVPTLGHGSTHYEDGTPVKLGDKITPERAERLARNLMKKDEKALANSLPGVKLHLEEFEVYVDFIGQYGIGNWRGSTSRKRLLAGDYAGACKALLRFRYAAGYDCSTLINGKPNKRCYGVWTRQLQRHDKCMSVQ
jgi:lysozyme